MKKVIFNNEAINQIYKLSKTKRIPMVRDKTLELMLSIIEEHQYKDLLEIGTALGYSSLVLHIKGQVNIVTIEKNPAYFQIANEAFRTFPAILAVNADCLQVELNKYFDVIFIDGPKTHQIEIFEYFQKYLKPNGMIIVDNIFLKKITTVAHPNKNQQKMIKKLEQFKNFLLNHPDFNCEIKNIDDGVALVTRKACK